MEQAVFVKLTEKKGSTCDSIYIAANRINAIKPHDNVGSNIFVNDDVFHVRESPEEVLHIMHAFTFVTKG